MNEIYEKLEKNQHLSIKEAEQLALDILNRADDEDFTKKYIEALINKGEHEAELIGFINVLLKKSVIINHDCEHLLDVCGTGGSGKDRFNISTTIAMLCASFGIAVAKHGNVGSVKKNGSFDFLEALHIHSAENTGQAIKQLKNHHLCFLFAKRFHPVLKQLAAVRKKIAKRSIFNIIGPLCNPANPTHQIVGCTHMQTAEKIARTLQYLGRKKAIVVVGNDKIDELCPQGLNELILVTPNNIRKSTLQASDLDISIDPYPIGNINENADLFHKVFSTGNSSHPLAKHTAFSAALAIWMMNKEKNIKQAYIRAIKQIESKAFYNFYLKIKQSF